MTRTYAKLRVSQAAFSEIMEGLLAAGYGDQIRGRNSGSPLVDMHGIALVTDGEPEQPPETDKCPECGAVLVDGYPQ